MGNQVSVEKSINSVKQNSEKSITHRGVLLEAKWIPEDAALLKLDSLQLIRMSLEVVPSVIFRVETLTRLNLSGNKLVSITKIGSLKSLEYLDVACNCLDYLPDDLCLLENLKELLINGNQLTARSLPYNFEALKSLKVLDISNNKLATLETNLALFWQTISVTLYGNPWENATLLKINQSMTDEEVQNILGKYLEGQSGGIEESVKSHVKNPSNITKPIRQKIEATPVAIKNSPAKSRFESDLESTLKQKVPLKTSNEEASNITKPVANTSPIETSPTKDEPNSDNTSVDVLERSSAPLKTAVRASGPRGRKGPSPEFIAKNATEPNPTVSNPEIVNSNTDPSINDLKPKAPPKPSRNSSGNLLETPTLESKPSMKILDQRRDDANTVDIEGPPSIPSKSTKPQKGKLQEQEQPQKVEEDHTPPKPVRTGIPANNDTGESVVVPPKPSKLYGNPSIPKFDINELKNKQQPKKAVNEDVVSSSPNATEQMNSPSNGVPPIKPRPNKSQEQQADIKNKTKSLNAAASLDNLNSNTENNTANDETPPRPARPAKAASFADPTNNSAVRIGVKLPTPEPSKPFQVSSNTNQIQPNNAKPRSITPAVKEPETGTIPPWKLELEKRKQQQSAEK